MSDIAEAMVVTDVTFIAVVDGHILVARAAEFGRAARFSLADRVARFNVPALE